MVEAGRINVWQSCSGCSSDQCIKICSPTQHSQLQRPTPDLWRERLCELRSRNVCSWNVNLHLPHLHCEDRASCSSYSQLKNFGADWLNLIEFLYLSLPLSSSRPPKWSPGEVWASTFGGFPSLRGQAEGESHIVYKHIKTASSSHSDFHPVFYISVNRSVGNK